MFISCSRTAGTGEADLERNFFTAQWVRNWRPPSAFGFGASARALASELWGAACESAVEVRDVPGRTAGFKLEVGKA